MEDIVGKLLEVIPGRILSWLPEEGNDSFQRLASICL
jgi:hypothetical protein